MIKRNSCEWNTFINRLNVIKMKSNREVLCIKCWQMLNCKQKIKHLKINPDHKAYLLTSTQYASEQKICELAQGYNKLIKKTDGEEYMISPFSPINMALLNESNYNMLNGGPTIVNHNNPIQNIQNSPKNYQTHSNMTPQITMDSEIGDSKEQKMQMGLVG